MMDKVAIGATYEQDTKRYHKYLIDPGQDITGTIYISKAADNIPKQILVNLRVKELNVQYQQY